MKIEKEEDNDIMIICSMICAVKLINVVDVVNLVTRFLNVFKKKSLLNAIIAFKIIIGFLVCHLLTAPDVAIQNIFNM